MTPQNNTIIIVKYTEGVAEEVRLLGYTIDLDSVDGLQLIGDPTSEIVAGAPDDVALAPILADLKTTVEGL